MYLNFLGCKRKFCDIYIGTRPIFLKPKIKICWPRYAFSQFFALGWWAMLALSCSRFLSDRREASLNSNKPSSIQGYFFRSIFNSNVSLETSISFQLFDGCFLIYAETLQDSNLPYIKFWSSSQNISKGFLRKNLKNELIFAILSVFVILKSHIWHVDLQIT